VTDCDCHGWYDITEIGAWLVQRAGSRTVRDWASNGGIWRPGHCELSHEELTSMIRGAGGISCGHALKAMTRLSGEIELTNGLHRWAVSAELGIRLVPVEMITETEPVWAWS
jgi:hypothetical protein